MSNKQSTITQKEPKNIVAKTTIAPKEYGNIFKEEYAIIMNPTPYLQNIIFNVPRRMSGNHIFLIRKGTAHATINFKEYNIKAGDLIVIPENYIMYIDKFSTDADTWLIQCNFNTPEEKELVGIDTTILHLSDDEISMIENYFNLLHVVASKPIYGRNDFMHLIISLLYRIREMDTARTRENESKNITHAKRITMTFINMMVMDDVTLINIGDFAKKIDVSENYLSILVKKETGITVKKWIERKTEAVMRMLLADEHNYSLSEIAELVGYSSSPQVVRFFKRRTGMTPFEFRKAILFEKELKEL